MAFPLGKSGPQTVGKGPGVQYGSVRALSQVHQISPNLNAVDRFVLFLIGFAHFNLFSQILLQP